MRGIARASVGVALSAGALARVSNPSTASAHRVPPPPRYKITVLPTPGGVHGWAIALNNHGQIAGFVDRVHLGYEVTDEQTGTFRSGYDAGALSAAAADRASRWTDHPPPARGCARHG